MNLKDYIGKFVRLRNGLKGYILVTKSLALSHTLVVGYRYTHS